MRNAGSIDLTCIVMQNAMEEVNRRNLMGLFMPIDPVSAMLVIMVSRANIVKDTLRTLEKCKPQDFKKPLKVLWSVLQVREQRV